MPVLILDDRAWWSIGCPWCLVEDDSEGMMAMREKDDGKGLHVQREDVFATEGRERVTAGAHHRHAH